jgi:hypothetical protein
MAGFFGLSGSHFGRFRAGHPHYMAAYFSLFPLLLRVMHWRVVLRIQQELLACIGEDAK